MGLHRRLKPTSLVNDFLLFGVVKDFEGIPLDIFFAIFLALCEGIILFFAIFLPMLFLFFGLPLLFLF